MKLDFRGKSGRKMGFSRKLDGKLDGHEVISPKGWLEPPFARSNLDRFLQKTLEFIGSNRGRVSRLFRRFGNKFKVVEPRGFEPLTFSLRTRRSTN